MEQKVRDEAIIEHLLASSTPVKKAQEMLAGMGEEQRTLWLGERTIARHGCFGCHRIPGFETTSPIGTELTEEGSKLVDRLDFGYEEGKIPHTLPGWLKRKFLEPRVFDVGKEKRHEELLRMPKFHFSEEEADALVTAVLSFTKEQMPLAAQRLQGPEDRYVQKGARMVWDFNCQGCHQIGEEPGGFKAIVETQLEQEGREAFEAVGLSPPQLYNAAARMGEGSRVHTQWLHDFLQDPSQTIRPWLEVRMPTFSFTDEEANTLTHYFAALDRVPFPVAPRPALDATMVAHGRELFARWQCVKCHVVAGKLPDQDPSNMAPDLANVPQRLRADWLTQWLADPGRVQPGTRMPANFPANPAENAYPEILGGDQKQQVDAVRQYLLTLGPAGMKPAGRASRGGGAATAGQ
jgi:cytochrome c2